MIKKILTTIAMLLFSYGVAIAQTDTTLNGLNFTGSTPPTGYALQPLRYGCLSSTYCWPYMQMWDGTTKGTFDPVTGGFKVAPSPFLSNGNYLNVSNVTSTSTNSSLPAGGGTTLVIYNYGGKSLMYKLSTSPSTTVTSATADGILQPGTSQSIATGVNTNISYATFNSVSTTAMQVVAGSGIWTGSNYSNLSVTNSGVAGSAYDSQIGGLDNSGINQKAQITAPGVGATSGLLGIQGASNGVPMPTAPIVVSHLSTSSLANVLSAKGTAGYLSGFNCSAITGGSAGFCIAYNSATTPSAGALTGSLVLDFCSFDNSVHGCSLGREPMQVAYSAGIQILVTTASSPYTYTTGTDTAAISADFQ
jgi:hypothetical protein